MTAHLLAPRAHSQPQVLRNLLRISAYHDLLHADPVSRPFIAPDPTLSPRAQALSILSQVSALYLRLHGVAPPGPSRPLPDHFAQTFAALSTVVFPTAPSVEALPLLSAPLAESLPRTRPAPSVTLQHIRLLAAVHSLLDEADSADRDTLFRLALDIAINLYYLGDSADLFSHLCPHLDSRSPSFELRRSRKTARSGLPPNTSPNPIDLDGEVVHRPGPR